MRAWEIKEVASGAFRHGQGYAESNIYRSTGRFIFKNPEAVGLPDYVTQLSIEDHKFLSNLYRHAFRAGLKSATKRVG